MRTVEAAAGGSGGGGGRAAAARLYLEALAFAALGVAPSAVGSASRGPAAAASARQLAMYLAHTRLGLSFTAIGLLFDRDRTTAAHACRTVEERREEIGFDALVERLERVVDLSAGLVPFGERAGAGAGARA